MSTAAATADAGAAPPAKGKKKLIIIIVAVVLLLVIGGGAAFFLLKKKPAEGEEEGGDGHAKAESHEPAPKAKPARDPKHPPVFVPLDPFTVNLADRESERYAQIGMTLEIDDPKFADQIKTYMPAIRNNILMVLAHKTSTELLQREGKQKLAAEVAREAVRPMGIEVGDAHGGDAEADAADAKKTKKKRKPPVHNPVRQVHFSNFIVQ